MGLFSRHENQKEIINIIKNSGSGDFLIWKQPEEDFNTKSKLVVMPGEMAVFVNQGKVVQTFTEGTYELTTKNYPFITSLVSHVLSGGVSAFHCVIYFFRKADSKEISWGTNMPIQVRDKVYGIRTSVRARGVYKVRITDPVVFLDKLAGNNVKYQEQSDLNEFFANEMLSKIKTEITSFLNSYPDEFIGIESHLGEISETLTPQINALFEGYGLYCVNFTVSAMDVDTSKYDEIDKAQVESIKRMKQAQGEQAYMATLGDNWDKMQTMNMLNNMAKNPNAGGMGTIAAGLGMASAVGKTVNDMTQKMVVSEGASAAASSQEDPIEVLSKLKKMLDAGLIEQEEYNSKKSEILARM